MDRILVGIGVNLTSNVSVERLKSRLERSYSGRYKVLQTSMSLAEKTYETARSDACIAANTMRSRYKPILSIGIARGIRPGHGTMASGGTEIAWIVKEDDIREETIELTPISYRERAMGKQVHEISYSIEAIQTLLNLIKEKEAIHFLRKLTPP